MDLLKSRWQPVTIFLVLILAFSSSFQPMLARAYTNTAAAEAEQESITEPITEPAPDEAIESIEEEAAKPIKKETTEPIRPEPAEPAEANKNAFSRFIEKNRLLLQGAALIAMAYVFERVAAKWPNTSETPPPESEDPQDPQDPQEPGDPEEPQDPQEPQLPIENVGLAGFYVNWNDGVNLSWDSFRDHYEQIDPVIPFWYSIDTAGEIIARHGGHIEQVHNYAKNNGVPIMPLLNNYSRSGEYLNTVASRQRTAQNILSLLNEKGYDGVNIDLEMLPPWQRDNYTEFIKELSRLMRPHDLKLTISVFPVIDVPWDMHNVFDYAALAPYVDYMAIMTYDHHWAEGTPGPISPLPWVEENVLYALERVPAEKLLLGIANYGYDWLQGGRGETISAKQAHSFAAGNGIEIQWSATHYAPYFNYKQNMGNRTVWFENSYSMEFKKRLVEEHGLGGMAVWRLGNEDARFWEILQ